MRSTGKQTARMAVVALAIAAFANAGQAQQSDARAIRALSDQWQRDLAAQNLDAIVNGRGPFVINPGAPK